MSYCRWSTDDFQCDVYAYESNEGFVVHIANNRIKFSNPLPPKVDIKDAENWIKREKLVHETIKESERIPIGLKYDGKCFTFETLEEMYEFFKELRSIGYIIPNSVMRGIESELVDDGNVSG